jgi:hypothetical protein
MIPNELKITINTNIPGYQNIKYKPSMTLPNDKVDNNVQFNPLVKLNSSIIDSLPNNIQLRQFFDKGLFQSLINAHGLVKQKKLSEAIKLGYVDNNIKITLETIFPSNNILYINNQPYVIVDMQWTKGDWKINKHVKNLYNGYNIKKSRINRSKITKTTININIDMYLKKGTALTEEEVRNLKCIHQWNSIRRSYANMRGLNYSMLPDYNEVPSYKDTKLNNNSNTQKRKNYAKFNRTRRR